MKDIVETSLRASLCGLAIAFLATSGTAEAASPAYCALYAREYTAQFATGSDADAAMASEYKILEQSYYQCLNMDVEPQFPQTSVYFGEGLNDILGGVGGPFEGVAQGDTSASDEVVVDPPADVVAAKPAPAEQAAPEAKPTQTASAAEPRRKGRGSGLEAWTPEWEAWCKKHFPNSWDPSDGTIKPYGEDRRFCN